MGNLKKDQKIESYRIKCKNCEHKVKETYFLPSGTKRFKVCNFGGKIHSLLSGLCKFDK